MRTTHILSITTLVIASLFLSNCQKPRGCTDPKANNYMVWAEEDDGSCDYNVAPHDCSSDFSGNLSITNETSQTIHLFKEGSHITCIPEGESNFLVNIDNPNLNTCRLQIYLSDDIDNIDEVPNADKIYREWSVALSDTDDEAERVHWLITDDNNSAGAGTVKLTYPKVDDYGQNVIYQVDVYLNSKSGAKIASLQPGIENKQIRIDYGLHYLYFRYWYSDPNSTSGDVTELGWSEAFDVVMNAQHLVDSLKIPFYYSNIGKYGELKIVNTTNDAVTVYANDVLIENITKIDGSTQGLSTIPSNNSTTFIIPVNSYTITVKLANGTNTIVSFRSVDVLQDQVAVKKVGINHKNASFTNNSGETLLFFSESQEYLGKVLKPGQSSGLMLIDASYDSLLVINANSTKLSYVDATTNVNISTLQEQQVNTLEFNKTWDELTSGSYTSPDIGDSESTSMTANISCSDSVMLSFEYIVSSEAEYDKFQLLVNGAVLLEQSGEVAKTLFETPIPAGEHTVEWKYIKDDMFSLGYDNAQVMNIKIE